MGSEISCEAEYKNIAERTEAIKSHFMAAAIVIIVD